MSSSLSSSSPPPPPSPPSSAPTTNPARAAANCPRRRPCSHLRSPGGSSRAGRRADLGSVAGFVAQRPSACHRGLESARLGVSCGGGGERPRPGRRRALALAAEEERKPAAAAGVADSGPSSTRAPVLLLLPLLLRDEVVVPLLGVARGGLPRGSPARARVVPRLREGAPPRRAAAAGNGSLASTSRAMRRCEGESDLHALGLRCLMSATHPKKSSKSMVWRLRPRARCTWASSCKYSRRSTGAANSMP
jgi:hypothetical protein